MTLSEQMAQAATGAPALSPSCALLELWAKEVQKLESAVEKLHKAEAVIALARMLIHPGDRDNPPQLMSHRKFRETLLHGVRGFTFDAESSLRCAAELVEKMRGALEFYRNPQTLAQAFHSNYETLAPDFGYKTREASAVEWAAVPEQNRKLMVAVATVIGQHARDVIEEIEKCQE